jgi:acyl carrier protein
VEKQTVFAIISRERGCHPHDISLETRLDELGIDSLKAITILYELEEQFDIEVPNELTETVRTVGDIVNGINQLVSKRNSEWQRA